MSNPESSPIVRISISIPVLTAGSKVVYGSRTLTVDHIQLSGNKIFVKLIGIERAVNSDELRHEWRTIHYDIPRRNASVVPPARNEHGAPDQPTPETA
jgi:hypothetical protein